MSKRPGMAPKFPEEIWVAGKGPSLDWYDWSQAGPVRVCINESVYLVPGASHCIAVDYDVLKKYKAQLPEGVQVLRKASHKDYYFDNMWCWEYEKHAPVHKIGTATILLQVAYRLGARRMHLVGFDSVDSTAPSTSYAQCIAGINAVGDNKDNFRRINQSLFAVIEMHNLDIVWEHRSRYDADRCNTYGGPS